VGDDRYVARFDDAPTGKRSGLTMAEKSVRLNTTGMHCGSCAMLIQMTVEDLPGVSAAKTEYATGLTDVTYDSDVLEVDAIIAAIVGAGYGAEVAA
jgi:copper chaperone CopZ